MNPRQTKFAHEYAADPNGKQAAIRAGYAPKTAEQQASRLLRNVKVQQIVQAAQTKASDKLELTQQYVLKGLMRIADNEDTTVSSRVRAYELLGKHQGMFTERLEISQIPDTALVNEWIDALEDDLAAGNG